MLHDVMTPMYIIRIRTRYEPSNVDRYNNINIRIT